MKAVLVIDMPTRCSKCLFVEELFNEYGEKYYYCPLHKVTVPKNGDACEKLKPLPQMKDECYYYGELAKNKFAVGYNTCLEDIIGDNDDEV